MKLKPRVFPTTPQKLKQISLFFLIVCLSFFLSTINPSLSQTRSRQTPEIRGVWLTNIDSEVLFSQKETTKAINNLAKLNFNTLYPTVWNWGYTLYPSQVAKKAIGIELDPTEGLQKRDILKEIVKQGHQRKMAVIPWFEFGFMAPADSELAKRHPNWLTQRQDGSKIWLEGNTHERVWLNPLHPEVQKFIQDLIVEIINNYDIDGIQVDDHFGYPAEFGYDPLTVKLYQQDHQSKNPPEDPSDSEWIAWRAGKITEFMTQLFKAVKTANSEVIMSVSPNPQEFSYNSYLLDWEKWERLGLVEELVLQIYRSDIDVFKQELEKPEVIAAKEHIPVAIGILTGIKPRRVAMDQIKNQVKTVRELEFGGVSFFFYESLWNLSDESPRQRQAGFRSMFPTWVERKTIAR
jgi:uncharacterized lipoprotein YddW (UPF0748 family)